MELPHFIDYSNYLMHIFVILNPKSSDEEHRTIFSSRIWQGDMGMDQSL